jgi:SSS family solute:Na+ symporter
MPTPFKSILITFVFCSVSLNVQSQNEYFQFSSLPDLPANSGMTVQAGLAGPYAGIDDDVLILAGGANFHGKVPWEGGEKVYYNDIFVLKKLENSEYSWSKLEETIPFTSAYGGAISTPAGLLCFGGNTSENTISASWLIDYIPEDEKAEIIPGPSLPIPLKNFAFAALDGFVYVAGGISSDEICGRYFYRLDISDNNIENWKWEELSAWEGQARAFAIGVAQSNGVSNCFYLFSGRNTEIELQPEILYDAHVYDPSLKTWTVISDGKEREFQVMAGTAFPVGASTIAFSSGANGEMMMKQLELEKRVFELISESENGQDVKS